MKTKSKFFLFIIFMATLFIGIGYASINSVSLDIKGTSNARSQDDIYITEVSTISGSNTLSNVSNEGTLLTSRITLENDKESTVSINVRLYNSTDNDYVFNDIVYTEEKYNNTDITFSFNKKDEILKSGETLEVTVTFKYDTYNSQTSNILESMLNFKFVKLVNITYIGFDSNEYPEVAKQNETFELTFNNEINNLKIKNEEGGNYLETSQYTFDGKNLVIENVSNNLILINVDGIRIVPNYTFSNSEQTINMGGYNVYRSNTNTAYIQTDLVGTYDISKMLYVEFDLYVPTGYDLTKLYDVDSQIELSSSGFYDKNEITYGLNSKEFVDNIKLGEWNHIVIPLSNFKRDIQPTMDLTNLNYIGIYWNNTTNSNESYTIPNCKIKNFMFSSYIL